jgi:hypothetical protein
MTAVMYVNVQRSALQMLKSAKNERKRKRVRENETFID